MKKRLDLLLVEKGLCASRTLAQSYIMAGRASADGAVRDKPSYLVNDEESAWVKPDECEFVSRGGLKLKKALNVFGIDVAGKTGLDIGASTGGFTDCLLKNGAARVYAVDVGYGQIALKLREDGRVTVMERMNARYLTGELFDPSPDFAVMDASFISIRLLIPPAASVIAESGFIVALIKPQFEAGREKVGKRGVVRDPNVHAEVINEIVNFVQSAGLFVLGLDYSPIKGPNGNIEFLIHIGKNAGNGFFNVDDTVAAAHGPGAFALK